jgi:hypothetical protein
MSLVQKKTVPIAKKTLIYKKGHFLTNESDQHVEFSLDKGLLKPQVEELLLNHKNINTSDDIFWLASNNFYWPNRFVLKAKNIDHLLNRLLEPYRLIADFKGNGTVVIRDE